MSKIEFELNLKLNKFGFGLNLTLSKIEFGLDLKLSKIEFRLNLKYIGGNNSKLKYKFVEDTIGDSSRRGRDSTG